MVIYSKKKHECLNLQTSYGHDAEIF